MRVLIPSTRIFFVIGSTDGADASIGDRIILILVLVLVLGVME